MEIKWNKIQCTLKKSWGQLIVNCCDMDIEVYCISFHLYTIEIRSEKHEMCNGEWLRLKGNVVIKSRGNNQYTSAMHIS